MSSYHQQKSQKCTRFFFQNHLYLPLAKFALMLFCQKLSRFIASKSWDKLQSSQFIASKSLKKVQSFYFRFIFSKTRKNVMIFFNQLNLLPANVFFLVLILLSEIAFFAIFACDKTR